MKSTLPTLLALALASPSLAAATTDAPGIAAAPPADGRFVDADGKIMVPYAETIPGTKITFEMIPVPGGDFFLGSPAGEAGRSDDEGPQVRVSVPPFWIGKCEVTWAEYHAYMDMYKAFKKLQSLGATAATDPGDDWKLIKEHARDATQLAEGEEIDGVTSPTPLYDPSFTYGSGEEPNQPAVTMTQYAARQYTKWLSGVTGREYRLPGEAEWEYAARAGTTTAYSFGDDGAKLADYAWIPDNSEYATHPVGTKLPNPWGLHDMHGNVAEWTLDEYAADRYAKLAALGEADVPAAEAVLWPTKLFPRVARGGSWLEEPDRARSAARLASADEDWKISDPNFPHSPWWYTEEPATGVGMRIIRPLAAMTADQRKRVWEADVEGLQEDVRMRLNEGRGALGVADPTLPAAIDAAGRAEAK